jgi:hypothetical protein
MCIHLKYFQRYLELECQDKNKQLIYIMLYIIYISARLFNSLLSSQSSNSKTHNDLFGGRLSSM